MKKQTTINKSEIKGKTREEIIDYLGDNYHPELDDETLVYIISKNWLNRKEDALYIEFNKSGKADTIFTYKNYDFKK